MMRPPNRPIARLALALLVLALVWSQTRQRDTTPTAAPPGPVPTAGAARPAEGGKAYGTLARAVQAHAANVEVETGGRVTRLLPDDTEGSRHQKFLIRTDENLSILVVYNLDLAPRVPAHVGDSVTLRGEYVWNDRGGLIHWTHHDPAGRHQAGWVEVRGRRYQ